LTQASGVQSFYVRDGILVVRSSFQGREHLMKSDYLFGGGSGKISNRITNALHDIAQERGAYFIAADTPEGARYWFGVQRQGEPIDSQTARDVLQDAEQAGLWPIRRVRHAVYNQEGKKVMVSIPNDE
jgi:hypothetical protein